MRRKDRTLPAPITLLLGLVLGLALELPAAAGDGEALWLRLDSGSFTVFSNAGPETTVEVGTELETLRAALAGWMGPLAARSPLPTFVYVFRDEESFWPYKQDVNGDPRNVAGFFLAHPHGNYVAINASPGSGAPASRVIYHEYLHHFVRHHLPGVPLWFNEGLAELYASFEVEGGEALVGVPHDSHLATLRRQGLMPLEELFAVGQGSSLYNESERRGVFYAQSWALVHYLMVGDGERGEQMLGFLEALAGGSEVEAAFEAAFDARFETLEEELTRYVGRAQLPALAVPLETLAVSAGRLGMLSPAEALYRLGDLVAHSAPRRRGFSRQHFDRALELDPSHGGAWAGLGYLEDLEGSSDEALACYEKALELAPDDYRILYLHGRSRVRALAVAGAEAPLAGSALAGLEVALAALGRSLSLFPDFPEALATEGAAWAFHPQPRPRALEVLEEARRWLPERMDVAFNLAVLYARLGHRRQSRRLLETVLVPGAEPQMAQEAREAAVRAELLRARELARDGEVEQARAALEMIVGEDYDLPLAEAARALLGALDGGSAP